MYAELRFLYLCILYGKIDEKHRLVIKYIENIMSNKTFLAYYNLYKY